MDMSRLHRTHQSLAARCCVTGLALALLVALPHTATAAPCSQAFTFQTGQVLTAANLNANPANEVACINNVDATNIGPAGIYASQIKPISVGTAIFGGSVAYGFLNGINLGTQGTNTTGTLALNIANTLAGATFIRTDSTQTVSGVTASLLNIGGASVGNFLAINGAGDVGILGQVKLSSGNTIVTSYGSPVISLMVPGPGGFQIANNANSATNFSLTNSGNLTIAGTVTQGSRRETKDHIRSLGFDALAMVMRTRVQQWEYRADSSHETNVGPMANDAPRILTGRKRQGMNLGSSLFVLYAAVQQQQREIEALRKEVAALRAR